MEFYYPGQSQSGDFVSRAAIGYWTYGQIGFSIFAALRGEVPREPAPSPDALL
jgi:hypothetical protein